MKRGQHKSLCKDGERAARWIESFECVSKLILGRSEACRHKYAPGTLRITSSIAAGFNVKIYGGKGITDGFVYVPPECKETIKSAVVKKFGF
jgi:hypothetical protein